MSEADVDRFLWELEAALSHLDGDERLALVREAERLLHNEAASLAAEEDADDVGWYHYVQATAALGPPERLAAELTGEPLPDREWVHKRLWVLAGSLVALTLLILVGTALVHGELSEVGRWSGDEEAATTQRVLHFNVTEEADRVFLTVLVVPNQSGSVARVTVLDGELDLVFEGTATLRDHLEAARYLDGASGHWRVLVDLQDFTGTWRIRAMEEL